MFRAARTTTHIFIENNANVHSASGVYKVHYNFIFFHNFPSPLPHLIFNPAARKKDDITSLFPFSKSYSSSGGNEKLYTPLFRVQSSFSHFLSQSFCKLFYFTENLDKEKYDNNNI